MKKQAKTTGNRKTSSTGQRLRKKYPQRLGLVHGSFLTEAKERYHLELSQLYTSGWDRNCENDKTDMWLVSLDLSLKANGSARLSRGNKCQVVPRDISWHLVSPRGTSWYLVVPRGTSWYLVVPRGTSWFLVVKGEQGSVLCSNTLTAWGRGFRDKTNNSLHDRMIPNLLVYME